MGYPAATFSVASEDGNIGLGSAVPGVKRITSTLIDVATVISDVVGGDFMLWLDDRISVHSQYMQIVGY